MFLCRVIRCEFCLCEGSICFSKCNSAMECPIQFHNMEKLECNYGEGQIKGLFTVVYVNRDLPLDRMDFIHVRGQLHGAGHQPKLWKHLVCLLHQFLCQPPWLPIGSRSGGYRSTIWMYACAFPPGTGAAQLCTTLPLKQPLHELGSAGIGLAHL